MNNDFICGGYYVKARCIQESAISKAPPHVRETWDWLLKEANHKDNKYSGFLVERGQLFRSYQDIREGLAWYIGWRKCMFTKDHMKASMKFLRNTGMITTKKALGGVLITICNYNRYQNPKNYESTNESPIENTIETPPKHQPHPVNNKNDKNVKNDKKKERRFKSPTLLEIQEYVKEKGYTVNCVKFYSHYESNGWMVGRNKMKSWKASIVKWNETNDSKPLSATDKYLERKKNEKR